MFVCIYIVLLSFLAPAAAYVPHSEGRMDRLAGLDIFLNVPKADFLSRLRRLVVHILKSIRSDLFDSAKQNDLVNRLDVLVERKNSATRPAVWKFNSGRHLGPSNLQPDQ